MKVRGVLTVALLLLVTALQAADFEGYVYDGRKIQDKSETNQFLIIGAIQTSEGFFGTKDGPAGISFIRTQPVIGPRLIASRNTGLGQDSRVFAIDGLNSGDTYKLYDYVWSITAGRYTYYYNGDPGLLGADLLVKPLKPGIYYVGAYTGDSHALYEDYEMSEYKVLEAILPSFKNLPGWKADIEARMKELKK